MMLCPSVLYSVVSYCIVASYMLLSCICITMHVSLEPKSSKSPSKPWVEPFNYLMHPMAELRSELHTTRITLNMQSLDQKTKQTTGIVSMVPMKPTMWCYSATNNPRMDEHFFQPKKWLHFTKGGFVPIVPSHAWRYTTQIVGPGEVLAWNNGNGFEFTSMTHLLHINTIPTHTPTNTVYIIYIEIINKHLDDLSSLTTAKLQ